MNSIIHYVHILILFPFFLYVSLFKFPYIVYHIVFALGIFTLLYHIYLNIIRKNQLKWFHIFIVSPILLYIGYVKPPKKNNVYKLLLMLTFAMVGFHLTYLLGFNTG